MIITGNEGNSNLTGFFGRKENVKKKRKSNILRLKILRQTGRLYFVVGFIPNLLFKNSLHVGFKPNMMVRLGGMFSPSSSNGRFP